MSERSTSGTDRALSAEGSMYGYDEDEIETGERLAFSEMTETLYRLTKWVDLGDGKLVSIHKEEVETLGIKECAECGATNPDEEYGVLGVARIGGNLCVECVLNRSVDTASDQSDTSTEGSQ